MNFYQRFQSVASRLSQSERNPQNLYGLEALKKTYHYLCSGVYTDIRHKEVILSHLNQPIQLVAQRFGVSETALTKARYRIFKDLEDQLTPGFIKHLEVGEWKEADELLFLATHPNLSRNYVASALIKEAEQRYTQAGQLQVQEVALSACSRELQLLRAFSLPKLAQELSQLDTEGLNRLVYLILMLDGRQGTAADRHKLFHFLRDGGPGHSKK